MAEKTYKHFSMEDKQNCDTMNDSDLISKLLFLSNSIKEQKEAMKNDEDIGNLEAKKKSLAAEIKEAKAVYAQIIEEKNEHMDYVLRLLNSRKEGKNNPQL